jgi:hypothetical protein
MEADLFVNNEYRFGTELEHEIRVARDIRDRTTAWRFVREVYAREGYACGSGPDLWYGIHDALPSTTTFLLEKRGAISATLTVVFDSAIGLPADELYREELSLLRANHRRLAEYVSLVSESGISNIIAIQHLFRAGYLVADVLEGFTDFVITVNPRHEPFYRKILQFQPMGPVRAYEKVSGALATLLRLDLTTCRAVFRERFGTRPGDSNPYDFFFARNMDEIVNWLARERGPLDESSLVGRFLGDANIIAKASPMQIAYVAAATRAAMIGERFRADATRRGAVRSGLYKRPTALDPRPVMETNATRNNLEQISKG